MTDAMSQNKQLPNESYKQTLPSPSVGGNEGEARLLRWDKAESHRKNLD